MKNIVLIVAGLLLSMHLHAQVTIVDENTQTPDYSDYYAGVDAMDAGDYDTAIRLFTEAAEGGLAIAQYNLGVLYYSGEGVTQDYRKAFEWTLQAAEQGHINAMVNLGVLYYNETGVNSPLMSVWPLSLISRSRNYREAARWYGYAAEYDHGGAQYNLATMYQDGVGVDQSLVQAYKWARLARDNDIPDASLLAATLEREMSPAQLEQAQREYAEWVLEFRG